MTSPPHTLYVSYDGLLEALGESQVVTYLERLAPHYAITVLSFEKPADLADGTRAADMRARLERQGIHWVARTYHKWPPAFSTAWDVCVGIASAWRWSKRTGGRLVHVRGYVPALIGLALKRWRGTRLLFDMRGFWADEKVDAGHWARTSRLYWTTKACERQFFEQADAIVSLTHAGVREFPGLRYRIQPGIPIEVVPTCTDLSRFAPGPRDEALAASLSLGRGPVMGCVGTMSNWYLREPMLDYIAFAQRQRSDLRVLAVTGEDHARLRADAEARGVDLSRLILTKTTFGRMPAYFRLMDVGMFFIKPVFSKKGSAATKLGEFLASGVPVVINDGVGDSGAIVRDHRVGAVLSALDAEGFARTWSEVEALMTDEAVRARCRKTAAALFDAEAGGAKYQALYAALVMEAR